MSTEKHGAGAGAPAGRLRVIHVITSLGPGGAERQVELLVRSSSSDASVVSLYFGGLVADSIEAAGGRVHVLGMAGWRKATAVFRLARLLRRARPDVVHVHLLSGQLFGILASRLAGVPVVVSTEHSLMDDTIEGRPLSRWLRRTYLTLERMTDHTVVVSETARARLLRWGVRPERTTVIDNAVDFEAAGHRPGAAAAARRRLGVPANVPVVGAVGRVVPIKRFDVLIRAVAPLLEARDAHLVVVGEGPQGPQLVALAASLGIADRVHLPGPQPDVLTLLNAFDVFASPSRDETFGIAVVEAVANGLPTVYEACPAIDDLGGVPVATRVGPGAAADDPLPMRRALTAAIGRSRGVAPDLLRERYGAARVARAYDDLHHRLVGATVTTSPADLPAGAAQPTP